MVRLPSAQLAYGLAIQLNAVGIVDQPVHDAVSDAGIADLLVPVGHRHLAGQNGRTALISVVTDFQEIAPFLLVQGRHGEIIHHQNVDVGDGIQHPAQTPIRTRDKRCIVSSELIVCAVRRMP